MTLSFKAIGLTFLLAFCATVALLGQPDDGVIHYHELVPLGADCFAVQGPKWHHVLSMLVSAESTEFQGMTAKGTEHQRALYAADGHVIARYPGRVAFRVTASFRTSLVDLPPFPVKTAADQNSYLLRLKFRLVIFHGLHETVVKPTSVEMIGAPAEMPYDERVYRITADLARIPIADRVVLYVFDPDGNRLTKFHLDLM